MTYEDKLIPAGTKIVFCAHAGQAGTDTWDFFITRRDYKDSELSDEAWQFGLNHAETYGIYPESERPEGSDDDDYGEEYSENIEGWYEIYDPEEHDGHRCTGKDHWNEI